MRWNPPTGWKTSNPLATGTQVVFALVPCIGPAPGTYRASVIVSGEDIEAQPLTVRFTVKAVPPTSSEPEISSTGQPLNVFLPAVRFLLVSILALWVGRLATRNRYLME